MPSFEHFIVQTYVRAPKGGLVAGERKRVRGPDEAMLAATKLRGQTVGIVAFKWVGDVGTGESGRVTLLSVSGEIPASAAEDLGIEY